MPIRQGYSSPKLAALVWQNQDIKTVAAPNHFTLL
jgi:hypothetical protein